MLVQMQKTPAQNTYTKHLHGNIS